MTRREALLSKLIENADLLGLTVDVTAVGSRGPWFGFNGLYGLARAGDLLEVSRVRPFVRNLAGGAVSVDWLAWPPAGVEQIGPRRLAIPGLAGSVSNPRRRSTRFWNEATRRPSTRRDSCNAAIAH